MRSIALYLAARVAIFAGCVGLLYLLGLHSFYLWLAALVLSLPLSVVALRRPRQQAAAEVERRVTRSRARRGELRAALRGETESDVD